MWFPDSPGMFHETDPDSGLNKGLEDRLIIVRESQEFILNAHIHHDMFQQPRILMNDSELTLRLYKSSDKFTVMAGTTEAATEPRVEIIDMKLNLCQVHLSEELMDRMTKEIGRTPAIYPIQQTDMQKFVLQQGLNSIDLDNLFPNAHIPDLLVIALIDAADYNGSYSRSPLALSHNQMKQIGVYIDGVPVKHQPLKMRFTATPSESEAMEPYTALFTALNIFGTNTSNALSYLAYLRQYTCYAFNLSPVSGKPRPRFGNVKVEMHFNAALAHNVYAIVMSKRHAKLLMDNSRQLSIQT